MTTKSLSAWAATCRSIHSVTARRSSARATSSRPSSRIRQRPRCSWRSHQPPGSLPGPAPTAARMTSGSVIVGLATIDGARSRSASRTGTRRRPGCPPPSRLHTVVVAPRRAACASRVLLPDPGCPMSARTTRARRSRSSSIVCRAVVSATAAVTGTRLRGRADQGDVNVDVAQFRDVVAAGRQILRVNVPERVKHPPPVTKAVAGNGRRLHHVSPPHLRHPALR